MQSLSSRLESIDFNTQLPAVRDLFENECHPTITFWGTRVIEAKANIGSVSIDEIAQKVLNTGEHLRETDSLTHEKRLAGLDILQKIKTWYKDIDQQVSRLNMFTWIFYQMQRFVLFLDLPRYNVEHLSNSFRSYSEQELIAKFGPFEENQGFKVHPKTNGYCPCGPRWSVKEEEIRAYKEAH